jgi:metallo-beta-lactamase class B
MSVAMVTFVLGALALASSDERSAHIAAATQAAGSEFAHVLASCGGKQGEDAAYEEYARQERVATRRLHKPMKIFDNLYFVGTTSVSAWAIDTPEGIVLIDALNAADVHVVIEGLQSLGLDPARIKYVVVTHGHGDHFGGARSLQARYGAQVVMSARDWDDVLSETGRESNDLPPPRGLDAPPELTLGGETIGIFPIPGHTPGNVSLLFPVTERGRRHMVAMVSGLGNPSAEFETHFQALAAFRERAYQAGADVIVSNHPFNDMSLDKMRALRRSPSPAHPFVLGKEKVRRYLTVALECAKAVYGP